MSLHFLYVWLIIFLVQPKSFFLTMSNFRQFLLKTKKCIEVYYHLLLLARRKERRRIILQMWDEKLLSIETANRETDRQAYRQTGVEHPSACSHFNLLLFPVKRACLLLLFLTPVTVCMNVDSNKVISCSTYLSFFEGGSKRTWNGRGWLTVGRQQQQQQKMFVFLRRLTLITQPRKKIEICLEEDNLQ